MILDQYLKDEIEKLLKYYRVPTWKDSKDGATFFAEKPSQDDVFLNHKGVVKFHSLVQKIENLQHPRLKIPLKKIYGRTAIQLIIKDLIIAKTKNYLAISKILLKDRHLKWDVYLAITGITFDFEIELGVGKLVPPGLIKVPHKKKFNTRYPEHGKLAYVCIRNVAAPNFELAIEMASEKAKVALAFIPSGTEVLILRKAPEINESFAIANRSGTKIWKVSYNSGNRLVFFTAKNPREVATTKTLGKIGADLTKKIKSGRHNDALLLRASTMYYSSKIATDVPSKILLLVSCLECLLMEKFKKGTHSTEFTKRLQKYCKLRFKVSNEQRKFLADVYTSRCRVAHAAQRVFENLENILFLETIIYSLLIDFVMAKRTSHIGILKELDIV